MVRDVIVPIANVSASSNRVYAMCPTVTNSSDRTAAVGHLPVVTVVVDRWYRDVL
jgi:hypothetical protein